MRWSRRCTPRDIGTLWQVLRYGTIDGLDDVYEPAWVNYQSELSGRTLLSEALGNPDFEQRVAIANRLLDDGADVRVDHPLHTLLGRNHHDFELEASLLARMLDMGADVNAVIAKFGTPLETIAGKGKFRDADIRPFTDVLLDRPDIDLTTKSYGGRTVIENLRKLESRRADLVRRAEKRLAG